uniref:Amidohydrolase n=1 Tax=Janibacter limosus TaxID=53458 RepID=A0AC61U5I9_9MICO|nr:amidohydrolase family protein [Janibacter limosus]
MALDGLELHHHAIRIVPGREEATRNFFGDVLGLHPDPGAREVPGIPLLWMDVGQSQVHLFALEGVSEHARTPRSRPLHASRRLRRTGHHRGARRARPPRGRVLADRARRAAADLPPRPERQHDRAAPGRDLPVQGGRARRLTAWTTWTARSSTCTRTSPCRTTHRCCARPVSTCPATGRRGPRRRPRASPRVPPLRRRPQQHRAPSRAHGPGRCRAPVLSPTVGPYAADRDSARRAARLVNTTHAALVAAHPDRFSFFAALPLPHVDAALDEVEHALDTLGAVGVIIHCSVGGRSVADPAFEPVLAELDRRVGVLFLHPSVNGLRSPLVTDWGLAPTAGTVFEDTVAALHLMTARVPERFPGIDIIVPHLGGALPMLLDRLDNQLPMSVSGLTERPSETARRFWYDTVSHGSSTALGAAAEAFGADRLLAGSDYPVMLHFTTYAQTMAYHADSGLAPDALTRIMRTNARQLFGGL